MPFTFKRFERIPEVVLIEPRVFLDDRGWFRETYKKSDFTGQGIAFDFSQDNHSRSTAKGILRGLHFQKEPAAQGKVVRCVAGEIFDVAVDIRKGSPTYAKWVSASLSADNHAMVWVPPGFAHGVLTMSQVTEISYKVTSEYSPSNDRSVRWNDPEIGVKWPVTNPILSKKDAEAPLLKDVDNNFVWKG
ncbi:MAG TPA: dTDP-4-dehydrorhamnose 3,5-epimerase [Candidatus Dormibacteraeota bacterium]|nr:dTDP-4-dehydrorhamnose 3,5-epimerase [Candidatus Dormibacteraeota bacterium]